MFLLCAIVLSVAMGVMPGVQEIDCTPLPLPGMAARYTFQVTIHLSDQAPVVFPVIVERIAGPGDVANAIFAALSDPEWRVERTGNRVRVFAYKKSRVIGVEVSGDEALPVVRRLLK